MLRAIEEQGNFDRARIARLLGQAVEGIVDVRSGEVGGLIYLEFLKEVGLAEPAVFLHPEMSDGTLRLLGLLLAVFQPNRPSLLAIEEPEATVHPAIAELVLQVLTEAAADRQVLITTHSPDLLDAKELQEDQIRVVVQRAGRSIVAPLGHASRQAVGERLYTLGELLRLDELNEDIEAAEQAAAGLDLFGFGAKERLKKNMEPGAHYHAVDDQVAFAAVFDLEAAARWCPSFARLLGAVKRLAGDSGQGSAD